MAFDFLGGLTGGLNGLADPFIETDDEREADRLQDQGNDYWEALYNDAPSAYDLAGYSMPGFGEPMPDEWFQNWMQENPQALADSGMAPSSGYTYSPDGRGDYDNGDRTGTRPTYVGTESMGGRTTAQSSLTPWTHEGSNTYVVDGGAPVPGTTAHNKGGAESTGRVPGTGTGNPLTDMRSIAEEAWRAEQMQGNPLWGLQVNDESALAGAQADPNSIAAQNRYLGDLRGIYEAGGYTDVERGQNRLAQQDAARFEQSQRAAQQQQMAMRGMNQSGASMMGALAAQQGGANRAADSATQFNIAGHQRALDALQNYGTQANDMRRSSWDEDTTRRTALDTWNQYRTDLIGQRQRDWGQAQGDAYGYRQQSLAGATGQWNGSTDRADAQEAQTANQTRYAISQIGSGSGSGSNDDEEDS
jgi:hypothetical protein